MTLIRNILITGATGDIGKKLKLSLERLGFNTISISRKKIGKNILNIDLSNENLEIEKIYKYKIDVIIHLAFDKFNFEKSLMMTRNIIRITNNIKSVNKLIFISSWCSYLPNRNKYSKYKYDSEILISDFCKKDYSIIRPTVVNGYNTNWNLYLKVISFFIIPFNTNVTNINDLISEIISSINKSEKNKCKTIGNKECQIIISIFKVLIVQIFLIFIFYKNKKFGKILQIIYLIVSFIGCIYFRQTDKLTILSENDRKLNSKINSFESYKKELSEKELVSFHKLYPFINVIGNGLTIKQFNHENELETIRFKSDYIKIKDKYIDISSSYSISECQDKLEKVGKTLESLPNYGNIKIGSAIMVNAHGSNYKNSFFNSNVIKLTILDKNSNIKDIKLNELINFRNSIILYVRLRIINDFFIESSVSKYSSLINFSNLIKDTYNESLHSSLITVYPSDNKILLIKQMKVLKCKKKINRLFLPLAIPISYHLSKDSIGNFRSQVMPKNVDTFHNYITLNKLIPNIYQNSEIVINFNKINNFIYLLENNKYFNLNSLLFRKSEKNIGIDVVGSKKDIDKLFKKLKLSNISFNLHNGKYEMN